MRWASRIPRAFPLGEGGFSANCLQFVEKTDEVLLAGPQKPSLELCGDQILRCIQSPTVRVLTSGPHPTPACGAMSKSSILPWQSRLCKVTLPSAKLSALRADGTARIRDSRRATRDRQAFGLPPCRATFPKGEGFWVAPHSPEPSPSGEGGPPQAGRLRS